jgi:hypothetical protein
MIEHFKANIGKKVAEGNNIPLINWLDGTLHDAFCTVASLQLLWMM